MTPSTADSDAVQTNYRVRLATSGSAEDMARQLALAWASLGAERGVPRARRVTVLRPVSF